MADDKRGTKRQCEHCGMKYYDLNRDPILCPGCKEPYVEPAEPTPRKAKTPAEETPDAEKNLSQVEIDPAAAEAGAEVVSFEEAEVVVDGDDAGVVDPEVITDEVITDVEGVEDIGGEVDNSFVEDEDDDVNAENFGLNTAKDDE